MALYFADDYAQPGIGAATSGSVKRPFIATAHTMLGAGRTTIPLGFLITDLIVLAPIPANCVLDDYLVAVPSLDTGTAVALDLGDDQALAGAVSGTTSGAQTTPALPETTNTLTLTASSASFSSGGIARVGSIVISYTGVSGSTLTGCTYSQQGAVIPAGSIVQQCANTAAYNAIGLLGRNATGFFAPWGNITSTTATAATVVNGALPANYGGQYNAPLGNPPTYPQGWGAGNVAPVNFTIYIHTSPTTNPTYTTAAFTGWISYHAKGYQP